MNHARLARPFALFVASALFAICALPSSCRLPSPIEPSESKTANILVLVADKQNRDLLLQVLGGPQVFVAAVDTPVEARTLLTTRQYSAVVATNFGVSPWEAINVIPASRSYPAFFVSAVWDTRLESACRVKQLHCVQAPYDPPALRDAVYRQIGLKP